MHDMFVALHYRPHKIHRTRKQGGSSSPASLASQRRDVYVVNTMAHIEEDGVFPYREERLGHARHNKSGGGRPVSKSTN